MIRAVLFDLDGVLVDACEWHYEALNEALSKHAGIKISRDDHENRFNGLSTKVKLNMLGISGETADLVWQTKQEITSRYIDELDNDECKIRLFNALLDRNIRSACVTNAIRMTAETATTRLGIRRYLQFVISNEDTEKNKPAPDCYHLAMKRLQLTPGETLIVEDSPKGLQAAHASGAHVMAVPSAAAVNRTNVLARIKEIQS